MAELSSTKVKEKKVEAPVIDTPSDAKKQASDGVSATEAEQKPESLLEDKIVKAFKDEFKGMPYTELSVIVCCGSRNAPTYQEIELPMVAELLLKHREK
jgi:hypothetical protein